MIPHKLNKKLLILALIGIVMYFLSNMIMGAINGTAMDEEMGKPAVSQQTATDIAVRFAIEQLGIAPAETSAVYQNDKYASGYVTKESLQEPYKELIQSHSPLNYWVIVINGATADQQAQIRVSMEEPARVTAWDTLTPLGKKHNEKSLPIALKALNDGGFNPENWTYQPAAEGDKANVFTFISKQERLKDPGSNADVPLAVSIGVENGKAAFLTPHLQVPDSYMDWIKSQEKLAKWMTGGFLVFTVILGIVALILAIVYARQVRWSRGIILAVVFLALYLVSNFNSADAVLDLQGGDPAARSITVIIMNAVVVVIAVLMTMAVWFSLISGEQQSRKLGWNLWPRFRDKDFGEAVFYGMGRGYLICLVILGVQQVLFLVASLAFDSFSISDPSQSTINMKWPYLFPATAWVAAIMEEAIYRLFGVALFKRILRYNFPALLAASLIWGLGHTGYTIYPSYTRLMEVTILGLIFGYVFLKYGFLTAVFAHAIMDSLLMSMYLMIEEPSPGHIAWGLFYIVLPALIGYLMRYLHHRFGGPSRKQKEPPEELTPPPFPPAPLPPGSRLAP